MYIKYDLYKEDPEKDEKAEFVRVGELKITKEMINTLFSVYYPKQDIDVDDLHVDWDTLIITEY